ncbi:Peptidyl-prolyl cis-trans isomerase FKBP14 [Fragariocoptes setiger]|uniref:peptidylprolyl isomerase n=1 Tax=Fragariocoptes setiger TaxID=1670756 RepID=A0ABQ7SB17_9ACAR|nr:Peptidyl-prolyl cis-trans isomerase FKBP14 [Fragariocoptes setiger]
MAVSWHSPQALRLLSPMRTWISQTQVRFNARQEVSRYHEPYKNKKHLLAACQPYYDRDYRSPSEKCTLGKSQIQQVKIHPLEEIYAKELEQDLRDYDLHLLMHRNYVHIQSNRVYKNTIIKLGGKFQQNINNNILRLAFGAVGREEAFRFFYSYNALITGRSDDLAGYLKALKKMPQLPLLAGYVGPYLLNKDQLTLISESNNIEKSLAALSLTLTLQSMQMSRMLERHSQNITDTKVEIHYTFKPEVCERKAKVTDLLTLHYRGALQDGTEFDSSYARNDPFKFQLGIGQVIQGWDRGLLDICVGEKRQLVIPPELGYGDQAHNKIPAGSTLVFDVECLKIEDGEKPINVFKEIDTDGDDKLSRKEVSDFLKHQFAQANPGGDHASSDDPENAKMLEEIFSHEDKDRDGYITREEFSGPKHDHEEL